MGIELDNLEKGRGWEVINGKTGLRGPFSVKGERTD